MTLMDTNNFLYCEKSGQSRNLLFFSSKLSQALANLFLKPSCSRLSRLLYRKFCMHIGYMKIKASIAQERPVLIAVSVPINDPYLMLIRQAMAITMQLSLSQLIGQFQKTKELRRYLGLLHALQYLLKIESTSIINSIDGNTQQKIRSELRLGNIQTQLIPSFR